MMEDDQEAGNQKAQHKEESHVLNYHDNGTATSGAASRWTTRKRRGRVVTNSHGNTAVNNTTSSGRRGGRAKAAKKWAVSMSSDPYEFYYYSRFRPLWGKRRGDCEGAGGDGEINDNNNNVSNSSGGTGLASRSSRGNSSSPPLAVSDFIDEEEEELDEAVGEIGRDYSKKRMRKPVKARSLKSLM